MRENEIMKAGGRNSSIELLRILCICGIVMMHTFGLFYNDAAGCNLIYGIFLNSLFNACVTIFMLISGYFGIKASKRKLLVLWVQVWICSLLSFFVRILFVEENIGTTELLKALMKAVLPISSVRFWYITAYFVLMLFADYVNQIAEKLTKKEIERLLLLLMVVFSLVPIFTTLHIMQDGGKGILNMFLVYLIGRYLHKYGNPFERKKNVVFVTVVFLIQFFLNTLMSFLRGDKGVVAPFARDYSIFIILLAIGIFEVFRSKNFYSRAINAVAKHVLGVYLLEGTARILLSKLIDLSVFEKSWYLFVIIFVYSIVVVVLCMLVDFAYKGIENRILQLSK